MKLEKKTRLFLVGCPRSGTTFLQSMLAAHPQILSFPETKFFWYLIPLYKEPWRRKLNMVSKEFKPRLEEFFKNEINRGDLLQNFSTFTFLRSQYTRQFIKILDDLAESYGKKIWLEKTPEHIYYVDYIEKFVPEVKFIHILRDGADVVASLYDVTRKHPQPWGGEWNLDHCIQRWIQSVEISRSHLHKTNHILVKYESLIEEPQSILKKLCDFIGVPFDEAMVQDFSKVGKYLSFAGGGRTISKGIQKANSSKFQQVLDEKQRQYVLKRLSGFEMTVPRSQTNL